MFCTNERDVKYESFGLSHQDNQMKDDRSVRIKGQLTKPNPRLVENGRNKKLLFMIYTNISSLKKTQLVSLTIL